MTDIGHNSIAGEQLRSIIERVERMEAEKADIARDIKEIYIEAKSNGYDPKIIRAVVKLRAEDAAKRQEREALLETYMAALGMLSDTPLGQAAVRREGLAK